jgi:hypothetical protein
VIGLTCGGEARASPSKLFEPEGGVFRLCHVTLVVPTATPTEFKIPEGATDLHVTADDAALAWEWSTSQAGAATGYRQAAASEVHFRGTIGRRSSLWVNHAGGADRTFHFAYTVPEHR